MEVVDEGAIPISFPPEIKDLADAAPERLIWATNPEQLVADLPAVGIGSDRYYRPILMEGTQWSPFQGIVMAIDPSGRGQDETSWSVVGQKNGLLYALDGGGTRDGYSPATLALLCHVAFRWKVNRIIVEANYGDGMFTQLLKPEMGKVYPCAIEEVKHSQQKERRILDTLEPVIASHRLVMNHTLIQQDYDSVKDYPLEVAYRYRLMYQLTRITRDRGALANDDRLDALAIAVAHFTAQMALEHAKEEEKDKERRLQEELQRFMEAALGPRARGAGGAIKRYG